MVVVQSQHHLLDVVQAARFVRGFASRLYGWKKNGDQNGNDGNHDEEFNQSEPPRLSTKRTHKNLPLLTAVKDDEATTINARNTQLIGQ